MGKHLSPVLYQPTPDLLMIQCPGCDGPHMVRVGPGGWTWDGNAERPTFSPSLLTRGGESGATCHLFVRDGQIQFLGDCTHALAGQTVPMPEVMP